MAHSLGPSTYGDCVASLRTSLTLLESSVDTLGSGVSDFPRLGSVLKTVRVRVSPPPSPSCYPHTNADHTTKKKHYELIPQPTLAAAEASLRDEIGPFVTHLLDRADRQVERQARRIETLKARSDLNAGRLSSSRGPGDQGDHDDNAAPPAAAAAKKKKTTSSRKTLDGGAGLRARAVRQRKQALQYSVERLELEVAQKERELRVRLQEASG